MWEIANGGRRQKDNSEWTLRGRIDRMPLILCSRKEGRRWIEGRGDGRAGGSVIDLGRGREGAFLGTNKESLCEGERDENCSYVLCLSVSPLSVSGFT